MKNSVSRKASRMSTARRRPRQSLWFGFAMFGLIGWTIAIPTFLGAALGRWLDMRFPASYSWTLTLLIVGLVFGCIAAWLWVAGEGSNIKQMNSENNSKSPEKPPIGGKKR